MAALQDRLTELQSANHYADIQDALDRISSDYGFNRYIYHVIKEPQDRPAPADLIRYPREWIEHYYKNRFREIDPVFPEAGSRIMPFRWDQMFSDRTLTDAQKRLFEDARDFNLGKGLTIPLHGPTSGFAVLCFATDESEAEFNAICEQYVADLIAIGGFTHEAMMRAAVNENDSPPEPKVHLTDRERDCLYWTAEGKSAWEAGTILGIKETTVRYHLENATRKLKCTSKHQAVIRAIMLNLLILD
ncbi:MAG: helix-turn-helix transcriptional regulator [Magnetovibrionaceae bacterium]